jgi:hypothetical protein
MISDLSGLKTTQGNSSETAEDSEKHFSSDVLNKNRFFSNPPRSCFFFSLSDSRASFEKPLSSAIL